MKWRKIERGRRGYEKESWTPKQNQSTEDFTIGTNDRQENLTLEIDNPIPFTRSRQEKPRQNEF
jgi:hypothetical protein